MAVCHRSRRLVLPCPADETGDPDGLIADLQEQDGDLG